MILAVGLTAATAGPAPIYVDNIRGNDTYDGSRERPFASLEKACLQVRTSGRIEVVNTNNLIATPQKLFGNCAANKPGATCN